jgi:hypothetical protein
VCEQCAQREARNERARIAPSRGFARAPRSQAHEECSALTVLLEIEHAEALAFGPAQPLLDHRTQHGLLLQVSPTATRDHEDFGAAAETTRVELATEMSQGLLRGPSVEIDLELRLARLGRAHRAGIL